MERKSLKLIHNKCPAGYVKRAGYTRKNTGKYVKAACIKSTSPYATRPNKTRKAAPSGVPAYVQCGPGEISRSSYIRHYTSKKNNKRKAIVVKAACVRDTGKLGKLPTPSSIGPLRQGELQRFGYSYKLPDAVRHQSLRNAISELGALNVYRKLDAVAKLTMRTNPQASRAFMTDRDWIRKNFVLKAF